jgi:hypothetical protein
MLAEMQQTQPGNATGKTRLLCLSDLDKRTVAYRRVELAISHIENDLGGAARLSTAQSQLIRHAALTSAMLEDMSAKWLSGEPIDPVQFCTLANCERRAYEAVGIERKPRDVTPKLPEYLAASEARP